MPYIKPEDRWEAEMEPTNVGELTYKLTATVVEYLEGAPSFSDYAEVLAALEATKLELYRRVIAPYENLKCKENGDVY